MCTFITYYLEAYMKKILFTLMFLFMTVSLTSCRKVVVNLNGGSITTGVDIASSDFQTIIATTPEKEGYVFAGWYTDATFTDYINPYSPTKQLIRRSCAFAKWIQVPEFMEYSVRAESATITDSGRSKQKMDIVYLSNEYNLVDLKRAGYLAFNVEVTLTVCEKDDGYQYVFLYSDTNCPTEKASDWINENILGNDTPDPSLIYTYKFEHAPGAVGTAWKTYTFETQVSLSELVDNLYIRYGASGKNDDTWRNKDLIVKVTPIK